MKNRRYKGMCHKERDAEWVKEYNAGNTVQQIADKWHYCSDQVSIVLRFYGVKLFYPQMNQLVNGGVIE